jgi:predicted acyltransferase
MELQRNSAIDRFRGLAVLMMAVANYLGEVEIVPAWLKHAPDIGFTITDTIASIFLFAVGLLYGRSFRKRAGINKSAAYGHFATRYLALIGIGAFLSAGGDVLAGIHAEWGVLQSIGVAGLFCLAFIQLKPVPRMFAGLALLTAYQFMLDRSMLEAVLNTPHGGIFGAISWSAMLIMVSGLGDLKERGLKAYTLGSLAVSVLAVFAAFLTPISKNRVSASFILLTLAISAWLYLAIELLTRNWKTRGALCWVGENPLGLYVLHMLMLGLLAVPQNPHWYAGAPVWLVAVQLTVFLGILIAVAYLLHRKNIVIKL